MFGVILEVFWMIFWGNFWEPLWIPKMERQDEAVGGRMWTRGGQNAEEFGAGQSYPLPPVQISYPNLAGLGRISLQKRT